MGGMTARERFIATMHFKRPDHLPFCEWVGFHAETVTRWIREGLPFELEHSRLGGVYSYVKMAEFFGLERMGFLLGEKTSLDFGPIPRFMSKTLAIEDNYTIQRDEMGITKKISRSHAYSMPQFVDWPVKTIDDFEKIKKRFDPTDSKRYPLNWSDELIEYYKNMDYPLGMFLPGFFWTGRNLMGTQNLLVSFYKDPELIHEIMNFHSDFLVDLLKPIVEALKTSIDHVTLHEDLAYKSGPMISPKLFREFILPNYKKVTNLLKRNGIDTIFVDTDGYFALLIPLFLEAGVNGFWPLEANAGVDALALRREYGKSLLLIGNINKTAVSEGKDAIKNEIGYKIPYLKEEGGYIPSIDHYPSPDISLENYRYYLALLKSYL